MTIKEVIAIFKESKPWELLTQEEKQEAINQALKLTQSSMTEEDIRCTVGEVYLELR